MLERTESGMLYKWELAGPNGASFWLFPEGHHTIADVRTAKQELRANRDVVSIHLASEQDRDELYKEEVFGDERVRPLRWFEVELDPHLIRTCRNKSMPAANYVTEHVLPNVEKVRERNMQKHGAAIQSA